MAPKESPDVALARARVKRDCALKSIEGIHVTASDARSDANKLPSLNIRAEDLGSFVRQFVQQQDIIVNALIDLDRVIEFDRVDRPATTKMESTRFEIKTIVASDTSNRKSASSTSTLTVPQHFVQLPKIKLSMSDGNLLSRRSFRDVSLLHGNTTIYIYCHVYLVRRWLLSNLYRCPRIITRSRGTPCPSVSTINVC